MASFDRADLHHQLDSFSPELCAVVEHSSDVLGGTLVFCGTRVPATALFDYVVAGDSLDTFLDDFPSVRRDQAIALLEFTNVGTGLPSAFERLATAPPVCPEISPARFSQTQT
jgi:uncharacterized protein (DUF433 family)